MKIRQSDNPQNSGTSGDVSLDPQDKSPQLKSVVDLINGQLETQEHNSPKAPPRTPDDGGHALLWMDMTPNLAAQRAIPGAV